MRKGPAKTVADVEGPWVECEAETSLIARCRAGWNTPVVDLTNELLATYLRQRIGLSLTIPEARNRLARGFVDDTELYDGQLANALRSAEEGE